MTLATTLAAATAATLIRGPGEAQGQQVVPVLSANLVVAGPPP
jgi:hypothetical protein